MAPNTHASSRWATSRVLALPELWTLVAQHSGLVGAWRLTGVCRASREGARVWLRALPGFVTCGGLARDHEYKRGVWRLDLGELRWEHIADLALPRAGPACCAVRGGIAVLGGQHLPYVPGENELEDCYTASVGFLEFGDSEVGEQIQSKTLPPMSCGPRSKSAVVPIHESQSELGQILLIGGAAEGRVFTPEVHKVDLATGVCTPLPPLLGHRRPVCTAARLPDGRVVCVGKNLGDGVTAEILEEVVPDQGSLPGETTWRWRELPGMNVARYGCVGCVLSDGRFAVFGGLIDFDATTRTTACEVLILDDGAERWETLPPMHDARFGRFACAAVGRCVIAAAGNEEGSVEVYEEALGRWRRFPCNLPAGAGSMWMGRALM